MFFKRGNFPSNLLWFSSILRLTLPTDDSLDSFFMLYQSIVRDRDENIGQVCYNFGLFQCYHFHIFFNEADESISESTLLWSQLWCDLVRIEIALLNNKSHKCKGNIIDLRKLKTNQWLNFSRKPFIIGLQWHKLCGF